MCKNLLEAGRIGNIYLIKYFIENGVDPHCNDDELFCSVCSFGYFDIVKYLVEEVGGVDIHAHDDWAFREAVAMSHYDIVEYIWNIGNVDLHMMDDHNLSGAVIIEDVYMVKYLLSLDNYSDEVLDKFSYFTNNPDIKKILYDKKQNQFTSSG